MFQNAMLRGFFNRSMMLFESALASKPERERYIGMIQASMISVALGHACYPNAVFGAKEADDLLIMIKESGFKPVDAKLSWFLVESWLDRNEISMEEAFSRIWGIEYIEFLNAVFNRSDKMS
jgi:hypothetical protein